MNYEETVSAGYLTTLKNIRTIRKVLETLPKGSIVIHTINGRRYPYLHYYENGRMHTKRLEGEEEAVRGDLKKYKQLQKHCRFYEQELKRYERALKIAGIDGSTLLQRQAEEPPHKQASRNVTQHHRILTLRGELVISKSEMMIADALAREDIPYEYEKDLLLDGRTIKPDFTIYWKGATYYWEHCGMMDNADYVKSWNRKKERYQRNGIMEGSHLIVTYESQEQVLTETQILRIITAYFQ